MNARTIFMAALDIDDPAARDAYLEQSCRGNQELRERVDALIHSHEQADGFLISPPAGIEATAIPPVTEQPGDTIGPYKLLQQIGEGGMGVVYMAEQKEPVKRRVALKIIKPGMDTRQVIARFEAERQALAMMDHPNIARVLDAGATETGRPYFVMELVNGIPLTEYCDEQRLTPTQRLELFVPVCQAVQHAHQKGVIHRDLKPGNILVAQYDHKAVPKVIDFGVAKATSQTLTEKTMFTQLGQIVGTLDYMSPEQARRNQLDVDTRSDIYSLGVILYELLTGETPFDKQRLRSAAFDEMLRIIREEEPPRPSTKLSSSETLPSIAANRQVEPGKLGTLIRGELDWIVMKALEKDRGRRYDTASAFAADVQHYLNDEAVVACPPSAGYRFRKFARRNRATIAVTASALLVLVLVAIGSSITAGRFRNLAQRNADLVDEKDTALASAIEAERRAGEEAARAEQEAENASKEAAIAQAVNDFLNDDLLSQADPSNEPDRDIRLRTVLDRAAEKIEDRFTDQPRVEAAIRETLGVTYSSLGEYGNSEHHLKRASNLFEQVEGVEHPDTLRTKTLLANAISDQARLVEAEAIYRDVLDTQHRVLGREHPDTLGTMNNLANALGDQGRYSEKEEMHRQVLQVQQRVLGPEHPDSMASLGNLANAMYGQGQYAEAEKRLRELLDIEQRVQGPEHPDTLSTMYNLAKAVHEQHRYAEAEALHRETLEIRRQILGEEHPRALKSMTALARTVSAQGRHDEAERLYREVLPIQQRALGQEHRDTAITIANLGNEISAQGRHIEGESLCRGGLEILGRVLGDEHPTTLSAMYNLGAALVRHGQYAEAADLLREAMHVQKSVVGPGHPATLQTRRNLLVCCAKWSRELAEAVEPAQRDPHRAALVAEEAIELFPEPDQRTDAQWDNLGELLYRAGRFEEARETLECVVEDQGDDGRSIDQRRRWWYYTMTLWQLGETERAQELFEQLDRLLTDNSPPDRAGFERLRAEAIELIGDDSPTATEEQTVSGEP